MSFVVSDCLCLPSSALCVAVVSSSLKRERERASMLKDRTGRANLSEREKESQKKKETEVGKKEHTREWRT